MISDETGQDPVVETKPAEPKPEAPKEGEKTEAKPDSSLKETEKKPEDKRSKYAQEQERRQVTWDKINQEKVALQQEKDRIAKEREELQRTVVKSQPFRDQHGFTASDYEAFAKQAEASGDKVNAEAAVKAAQAVKQAETAAKEKAAQDDHSAKWAQSYQKLSGEYPDLKNKDSEMYKDTAAMITQHPLLAKDPNGLALAVEAVNVKRMFKESQAVSAENKSLKEQIETLQKKLSLSSGVAAEPPKGETPFDKLSPKEQEAQLEKLLAAEAD